MEEQADSSAKGQMKETLKAAQHPLKLDLQSNKSMFSLQCENRTDLCSPTIVRGEGDINHPISEADVRSINYRSGVSSRAAWGRRQQCTALCCPQGAVQDCNRMGNLTYVSPPPPSPLFSLSQSHYNPGSHYSTEQQGKDSKPRRRRKEGAPSPCL